MGVAADSARRSTAWRRSSSLSSRSRISPNARGSNSSATSSSSRNTTSRNASQRGITYAAPLKVTLRLVVLGCRRGDRRALDQDIKEQDVYMGDMPLMTDERHLHHQRHRARHRLADAPLARRLLRPRQGQDPLLGQALFAARVIPYRGSWLDFEFDAKDMSMSASTAAASCRRRPCSMALDSDATAKLRAKRPAENKPLEPTEATGMSKEEILSAFYSTVSFSRGKEAGARRSIRALSHPSYPRPGRRQDRQVPVEAGEKLSPRIARKLAEDGLEEILVP